MVSFCHRLPIRGRPVCGAPSKSDLSNRYPLQAIDC
jgi:hypothetical protein